MSSEDTEYRCWNSVSRDIYTGSASVDGCSVALSEPVSNFRFLYIELSMEDVIFATGLFRTSEGGTCRVSGLHTGNVEAILYRIVFKMKGNVLSYSSGGKIEIDSSGSPHWASSTGLKLTRVSGINSPVQR